MICDRLGGNSLGRGNLGGNSLERGSVTISVFGSQTSHDIFGLHVTACRKSESLSVGASEFDSPIGNTFFFQSFLGEKTLM